MHKQEVEYHAIWSGRKVKIAPLLECAVMSKKHVFTTETEIRKEVSGEMFLIFLAVSRKLCQDTLHIVQQD